MKLEQYFNDLEKRINSKNEDKLIKEWLNYADGKCSEEFFSPSRPIVDTNISWPKMLINEAFSDIDYMIYHQLKGVSDELASGNGNLLNVRANYGTGIIPSMFDAEIFMSPDEFDTLPCTKTLKNGSADIKSILKEKTVDYSKGLAGKVFEFGYRYKELVKQYPKVMKYVFVYNPDLQGPFSLCDMLWGGDIYIALFEEDEMLTDFLEFMTGVYIEFLKQWHKLFPKFDDNHSVEWGLLHKGSAIIRNDAVMNISGDMYRDVVSPFDQKILDVFGGGIHFCGRGDHYIEHVGNLNNISCINLSQPQLNNMKKIYENTINKGIGIIGLAEAETVRAFNNGIKMHGLVQSGASLASCGDKGK